MTLVTWKGREPPLIPVGVIARGDAARLLIAGLRTRAAEVLRRLRGLAYGDGIVVVGPREDLPWADGAVYLGRDPRAHGLFLPTTCSPDVPLDLFELALRRRLSLPAGDVAVVPDWSMAISLTELKPLVASTLDHLSRTAPPTVT